MRTYLKTFCAVLATVTLLTPADSRAQSIPSPYSYLEERQELGVFIGRMDAATGRFGYGPTGGNLVGARYGIELSGPLSFEGVVQYIDGERNVIDPGRPPEDWIIGQAPSAITTIEARLKFTATGRRSWHRIAPFIDFGGGIALDSSPSSELDDVLLPVDRFDFGTSFFGTMSGGARWYATQRFTLRADWVFSLWKIDTPPGFADPDRGFVGVSDGEWVWGNTATIALLFRW